VGLSAGSPREVFGEVAEEETRDSEPSVLLDVSLLMREQRQSLRGAARDGLRRITGQKDAPADDERLRANDGGSPIRQAAGEQACAGFGRRAHVGEARQSEWRRDAVNFRSAE
jgi:hypothetical protein